MGLQRGAGGGGAKMKLTICPSLLFLFLMRLNIFLRKGKINPRFFQIFFSRFYSIFFLFHSRPSRPAQLAAWGSLDLGRLKGVPVSFVSSR